MDPWASADIVEPLHELVLRAVRLWPPSYVTQHIPLLFNSTGIEFYDTHSWSIHTDAKPYVKCSA